MAEVNDSSRKVPPGSLYSPQAWKVGEGDRGGAGGMGRKHSLET